VGPAQCGGNHAFAKPSADGNWQQCAAPGATRLAVARRRQGGCATGQRRWVSGRVIVVAGWTRRAASSRASPAQQRTRARWQRPEPEWLKPKQARILKRAKTNQQLDHVLTQLHSPKADTANYPMKQTPWPTSDPRERNMDANKGLSGCVPEREPDWTEVVLTTFTNLISGPNRL
jgi:hypothetical protein